jgi:hypothetical protein
VVGDQSGTGVLEGADDLADYLLDVQERVVLPDISATATAMPVSNSAFTAPHMMQCR